MSDSSKSDLNWRGLALKALGAVGGGAVLVGVGMLYSRVGGT